MLLAGPTKCENAIVVIYVVFPSVSLCALYADISETKSNRDMFTIKHEYSIRGPSSESAITWPGSIFPPFWVFSLQARRHFIPSGKVQ